MELRSRVSGEGELRDEAQGCYDAFVTRGWTAQPFVF